MLPTLQTCRGPVREIERHRGGVAFGRGDAGGETSGRGRRIDREEPVAVPLAPRAAGVPAAERVRPARVVLDCDLEAAEQPSAGLLRWVARSVLAGLDEPLAPLLELGFVSSLLAVCRLARQRGEPDDDAARPQLDADQCDVDPVASEERLDGADDSWKLRHVPRGG